VYLISKNISSQLINASPVTVNLKFQDSVRTRVFQILGNDCHEVALFRNLGKLFPPLNFYSLDLVKRGARDVVIEFIYDAALILGIIHLSLVMADLIRGNGFKGLRHRLSY